MDSGVSECRVAFKENPASDAQNRREKKEMAELRRAQQRVSAVLPVKVDGKAAGVTRDISPSGIFFETDQDMTDGSSIHFTLEFDNPSGKLLLECSGEIVRVEKAGGKIGVAAKIVESRLERYGDTNKGKQTVTS
jgi:PilZ domain